MLFTVTSNPDQQETTILEIDSTTLRMTVKLRKQNQVQPEIFHVKLRNLFTLQFSKYDLQEDRMFWGFVVYSVDESTTINISSDGAGGVVLKYKPVKAIVIVPDKKTPIPDRPAPCPEHIESLKLPSDPMAEPVPEPIQVTVHINPAGSNLNAGWINMDIEHPYPAQFTPGSGRVAWELFLTYPFLQFEEPVQGLTPPLQFAAAYQSRTDPVSQINSVSGVAVHIDDQHGNRKLTSFNEAGKALYFSLQNPIHLKSHLDGSTVYARPDNYKLSGFDSRGYTAYGYGGNSMMYRIRAFKIDAAYPGSPADHRDVLNIYRSWLKVRKPAFYTKLMQNRPLTAPADNMSPHTTICNYGFDGAIDPPPPQPPPRFPDLHKWLELHPIQKGLPDMPGNTNESLLDLLGRMKAVFPTEVKLEAQLWGWEIAGIFQYAGAFPPLTNVLSGNSSKFRLAMDELAGKGIIIIVTTFPLAQLFNRYRFKGHMIWKGTQWSQILDPKMWVDALTSRDAMDPKDAIPYSFPAKVIGLPPALPATCALTDVTIGGKRYNRIWAVLPFSQVNPNCSEALEMLNSQKMDGYGVLVNGSPALGSGLYRATGKNICPTQSIERIYLENWLRDGVFAYKVRLLEFMKHTFGSFRCYNKNHQHIVQGQLTIPPTPSLEPAAPFDNVIGYGSWYTKRCQSILHGVQTLGQGRDPATSFTLTNEFAPLEAWVPYFDEYYRGDESFHYVYSEFMTPKMDLGRDFAIHPGYRERRQVPNGVYARPDYFLHPDLDRESKPSDAARPASFKIWRDKCVEYFDTHFEVEHYGIAPKYYPTVVPPNPSPPLKPPVAGDPLPDTYPPTYTYNRCIQDVFNLRHAIFETGTRAVIGERVMIPSVWFESAYGQNRPPFCDYNQEAINMAVRAVRLQMTFKDFFRRKGWMVDPVITGFMLGEEAITGLSVPSPSGLIQLNENRILWAWSNDLLGLRDFKDVNIFVERIAQDNVFGKEWEDKALQDFISKGIDDERYSKIVEYRQIQNRIWQRGEGDARRVLYVFANLGNSDVHVKFQYGRGLEGVPNTFPWKGTITRFSESTTSETPKNVYLGFQEDLFMPARSFAAIEIKKV